MDSDSRNWKFDAHSEADTERLGRALAQALVPGLVVGLIGDLGSGKTRLVRATAEAAGVPAETVSSPTFVLIQEYEGKLPIIHCDVYRLRDLDEFLELGPEELFDAGGACFVEWADRVAEVLPQDRLEIQISSVDIQQRCFNLTAGGNCSAAVLTQVQEGLA